MALLQWHQKIRPVLWPRVQQMRRLVMGKPTFKANELPAAEDVERLLRQHQVPVELYGKGVAKSIQQLWTEIQVGEAVLVVDNTGALAREVGVVTVRVKDRQDRTLVEVAQSFDDGRRRVRNLPLSEKLKPQEDPSFAAERGIREELGHHIGPDTEISVHIDPEHPQCKYSQSVSKSYPGLLSIYAVHRVTASVSGLPEEPFTTEEDSGDQRIVHEWAWVEHVENN